MKTKDRFILKDQLKTLQKEKSREELIIAKEKAEQSDR
jgi:hypothetical protein